MRLMQSACLVHLCSKSKPTIMKIKSFIAFAGLLVLAVFSMAFMAKPAPKAPAENTAQKENFIQFLSQFKKAELPYTIGLNDMEGYRNYREGKAITVAKISPRTPLNSTRFIPGSEHFKFSRMGPPEMFAVTR